MTAATSIPTSTSGDREFLVRAVGQMCRFSHDAERIAVAALDLADHLGIEDPVDIVSRALGERLRSQANASS